MLECALHLSTAFTFELLDQDTCNLDAANFLVLVSHVSRPVV
jgi:hypothetical protein